MRVGQSKRLGLDRFLDPTATYALHTNLDGFCAAAGHLGVHLLQVRSKLSARNSSDLGADAAEIFGLTPFFDRIAHLGAFAANLTFTSHD